MRIRIYLFIITILTISCNNSKKITITKLEGSPDYVNSKLTLDSLSVDDKYMF